LLRLISAVRRFAWPSLVIVGWRGVVIVIVCAPASTTTASPTWSVAGSACGTCRALSPLTHDVEYYPARDANEDHPEETCRDSFAHSLWFIPATAVVIAVPPVTTVSLAIFLVAFVCKNQPVFNSTASFQDIGIFGVVVAFADDICGAELELVWQRSCACPLDILRIVVGSGVLAAHYVNFIEAFGAAAYA